MGGAGALGSGRREKGGERGVPTRLQLSHSIFGSSMGTRATSNGLAIIQTWLVRLLVRALLDLATTCSLTATY